MARRRAVALITAVLLLVQTGIASGSSVATVKDTRHEVEQILKVFYNSSACNGGTGIIQVLSFTQRYHRLHFDRLIGQAKLRGVENGRKCDGNISYNSREGAFYPVFGCWGRCDSDWTEASGFSVNWPYVYSNGGLPLQIAVQLKGYVNNGRGTLLGTICSIWSQLNQPSGCGDL